MLYYKVFTIFFFLNYYMDFYFFKICFPITIEIDRNVEMVLIMEINRWKRRDKRESGEKDWCDVKICLTFLLFSSQFYISWYQAFMDILKNIKTNIDEYFDKNINKVNYLKFMKIFERTIKNYHFSYDFKLILDPTLFWLKSLIFN